MCWLQHVLFLAGIATYAWWAAIAKGETEEKLRSTANVTGMRRMAVGSRYEKINELDRGMLEALSLDA